MCVAEPLGDRSLVGHAAAPMALVLTRRGVIDEAAELARTFSGELTKQFFELSTDRRDRARGELADAEPLVEGAVQLWVSEGSFPAFNFDLCDLARETVALAGPTCSTPYSRLRLACRVQGSTPRRCGSRSRRRPPDVTTRRSRSSRTPSRAGGSPATPMSERTPSSVRPAVSSVSSVRNEAVQPLNEARDSSPDSVQPQRSPRQTRSSNRQSHSTSSLELAWSWVQPLAVERGVRLLAVEPSAIRRATALAPRWQQGGNETGRDDTRRRSLRRAPVALISGYFSDRPTPTETPLSTHNPSVLGSSRRRAHSEGACNRGDRARRTVRQPDDAIRWALADGDLAALRAILMERGDSLRRLPNVVGTGIGRSVTTSSTRRTVKDLPPNPKVHSSRPSHICPCRDRLTEPHESTVAVPGSSSLTLGPVAQPHKTAT